MIYRLIILNGERRGEHITITHDPMVIGKAETCEIRLKDPEIALSHAEISHTHDGLYIRDLGSMNRLLVNNREVREAHPKHGDVLEVGRTRFLIQAFVQAEVQGNSETKDKNEDKRWRMAGAGVLLLAICIFLFIPRCDHFIKERKTRAPAQVLLPPSTELEISQPRPVLISTNTQPSGPETVALPVPLKNERAPEPPSLKIEPPKEAPPPVKERPVEPLEKTVKTPPVEQGSPPVQQVKTTVPVPAIPPITNRSPILPVGRLVKIASTDINKFPESDQFKEMRLLTIRLTATELLKNIDPEAIRVEVTFLERNKLTGLITPVTPGNPKVLTVTGKWDSAEQKSVAASYVVPATPEPIDRGAQYFGFIIRVYYFGKLQDELSQPRNLPRGIGSDAVGSASQPLDP